jgi:hypothetical protein
VFVRDPAIHREIRRLVALGFNDCEIARRVGIPRTTVRDIRRPRHTPRERDVCHRCWRSTKPVGFSDDVYAYVLGLYLGDGCIAELPRTYSLRLALDAKYPEVVDEAANALTKMLPASRLSRHLAGPRRTTSVLCVYGRHLPCLFPQHGKGKKHERSIVLEPWQQTIVDAVPWRFIRGLVQSDGCRFINRTGRYAYPSYEFSQVSSDIRGIFTSACDAVGVEYRVNGRSVRIYRRSSVELLDAHVGPKR